MNVLLVTVDTLRADRLGAYGDGSAHTPFMDRLARSGALFERAHAHNVVTLPSHANILSGVYPTVHGVRDNDGYRFPGDRDTLATLLHRAGYRTGAFVSGFPLDARFGLNRGFDVYDDHLGGPEAAARGFHLEDRRGRDTVAAALRWLGRGTAPSFCWVHLYDVHAPYRPAEPLVARFEADPYRGAVATVDEALRDLLGPLLDEGERGRTLVVLTADHGESLGEHGERTHGLFAYEATLKVPLIFWAPRLFGSRVAAAPIRHVDILPTVLELLGQPIPKGLSGRSLRPLLEGGTMPPVPSYFEALSASASRGWAPLSGVIRGRRKLIDLPIREVYDLDQDPGEAHNLAPTAPADVKVGLEWLDHFGRASDDRARLRETAETRERLASLGYLAATVDRRKGRYTEADDPKNLIALEADLDKVVQLESEGQARPALTLCQALVKRMPRAPAPLVQLASLQQAGGDLSGALVSAKRAFALDPRAPQVLFRLARLLLDGGRPAEVVSLVTPFAKEEGVDLDALIVLGVALAQAGDEAQGIRLLEDVHVRDPSNALCLLDLGTVHLMAREYGAARRALEEALALQAGLAKAHNALGVIGAETGRIQEAITEWKQAADLDPRAYDTVFNLGMLLSRQGRPAEARPYMERFAREAPRAQYAADIRQVQEWIAGQAEVVSGSSR